MMTFLNKWRNAQTKTKDSLNLFTPNSKNGLENKTKSVLHRLSNYDQFMLLK